MHGNELLDWLSTQMTRARWERARRLSYDGAVTSVQASIGSVAAHVHGTRPGGYRVELDFDGGHWDAWCSCPDDPEWCKHAGATVMHLVRTGMDAHVTGRDAPRPPRSEARTDLCDALRTVFDAVAVDDRHRVYRTLAMALHPDRRDGDDTHMRALDDVWQRIG